MLSCQAMGSSLARYWSSAQLPALLTVLPLIGLFAAMSVLRPSPSMIEALLQLAIGGALYCALVFRNFKKPRPLLAP